MTNAPRFRGLLLSWFDSHRRDLPWRRTADPWAILVSEIMLQQTRVEAVVPYYERFLARFPGPQALAGATESDILTAWAGLGYYSRVRNLQKAARSIVGRGGFPTSYDGIRELPGVGGYTAAAVSSIAFNLPHAALDGNVARVLARLTAYSGDIKAPSSRTHLQSIASQMLDRGRPGDFNQAMMELGAVVCTPRNPSCLLCPVNSFCVALREGRQAELPVRAAPKEKTAVDKTLLFISRGGKVLLRRRAAESVRLAGFWELPEAGTLKGIELGPELGRFRHTIVNHHFRFTVHGANLTGRAPGCRWWPLERLHEIPLSTTARKAVPCLAGIRSYR